MQPGTSLSAWVEFHGFGPMIAKAWYASGPTASHFLLVVCAVFLSLLAVRTLVAWFVCRITADCLAALPKEYQKQRPGLVWLLMIPLFPYVWNYFVFPAVSKSFASYSRSKGSNTDAGDCGWGVSLALCICADATLLRPFALAALVGELVLLVIVLLNMRKLRASATAMDQVSASAQSVVRLRPDRSRAGFSLLAAGFFCIAILRGALDTGGPALSTRLYIVFGPNGVMVESAVYIALYILVVLALYLIPEKAAEKSTGMVMRTVRPRVVGLILIGILLLYFIITELLTHPEWNSGFDRFYYMNFKVVFVPFVVLPMILFGVLLCQTANMILANRPSLYRPAWLGLLVVRWAAIAMIVVYIVQAALWLLLQISGPGIQISYGDPLFANLVRLALWNSIFCSTLLAAICAAISMNMAEGATFSSASAAPVRLVPKRGI